MGLELEKVYRCTVSRPFSSSSCESPTQALPLGSSQSGTPRSPSTALPASEHGCLYLTSLLDYELLQGALSLPESPQPSPTQHLAYTAGFCVPFSSVANIYCWANCGGSREWRLPGRSWQWVARHKFLPISTSRKFFTLSLRQPPQAQALPSTSVHL